MAAVAHNLCNLPFAVVGRRKGAVMPELDAEDYPILLSEDEVDTTPGTTSCKDAVFDAAGELEDQQPEPRMKECSTTTSSTDAEFDAAGELGALQPEPRVEECNRTTGHKDAVFDAAGEMQECSTGWGRLTTEECDPWSAQQEQMPVEQEPAAWIPIVAFVQVPYIADVMYNNMYNDYQGEPAQRSEVAHGAKMKKKSTKGKNYRGPGASPSLVDLAKLAQESGDPLVNERLMNEVEKRLAGVHGCEDEAATRVPPIGPCDPCSSCASPMQASFKFCTSCGARSSV